MAIIDAIINERLFNQLVLSWGKKAVMIKPSDRNEFLDRWEWKKEFNTDGLKLWIIQNARRASRSAGALKNRVAPTIDIPQSKIGYGDADLSADSSERKPEPESASQWREKGNAHYNNGQYDEAIKAYDKAIELDPKNAWPWNNKGIALKTLKRTKEANAAFARAKELGYKGSSHE